MAVRGIDYRKIEGHVYDLIKAWTGLPDRQILIAPKRTSVEPAPPRPFVSFEIMPPQSEQAPLERRLEDGLEYWRLEVTDATDGTYTVTMDGVDYPYVASGDTTTSIRDGLVTALSANLEVTVTATGTTTASIDIESLIPGKKFVISATPVTVTVVILRQNMWRCSWRPVEVLASILCWGDNGNLDPQPEGEGAAIATALEASFLSIDDTEAMRADSIVPTRASATDESGEINGDAESIGKLLVILQVNLFHAKDVSSIESASAEQM